MQKNIFNLADDFTDEEETDDKSNDFHGSESNSLALKSCNDSELNIVADNDSQSKSSENFKVRDVKINSKSLDSDVHGWRLVFFLIKLRDHFWISNYNIM